MNPYKTALPNQIHTAVSHCRFCTAPLQKTVVDLGRSPLCQKHIKPEKANEMEPFYPLQVFVCEKCWLLQLNEQAAPEQIFDAEYAYFSSYSESWLKHARQYTDLMVERFGINDQNLVMEIASNDGYLLQWFLEKNIPVLGIEPAANVATVAREKGIPTEVLFFGKGTARQLSSENGKADLLIGNNVLAHVPNLNDFVAGMKIILATDGIITIEFPHLQRLIEGNQFDTIYHEHFSYFSFIAVQQIFLKHGLRIFLVEELSSHGGSLRIYATHVESKKHTEDPSVKMLLERERQLGFETLAYYAQFEEKVKETKRKLVEFLIQAKREGKTIVGYGAPGKGNTLLNYCGIRTDFIDYTVDRNPHKQGNFLPGTHIPIYHPNLIRETRPDYVLILPWNLKKEISQQLSYITAWGGKFVVPIPEVTVFV